jgi:hypothetical protein
MNNSLRAPAKTAVPAASSSSTGQKAQERNLKVIIIRHGEKPATGDNLSCTGMNRALQLPGVLKKKFGIPAHTYVPSLRCGKSTEHARMFQTVAPFAIKHGLKVNSEFAEDDFENIAADVLNKTGIILMVWEHSAIQNLASSLGAANPPAWKDRDFDSIWIIDFKSDKPVLHFDKEGIKPASKCSF